MLKIIDKYGFNVWAEATRRAAEIGKGVLIDTSIHMDTYQLRELFDIFSKYKEKDLPMAIKPDRNEFSRFNIWTRWNQWCVRVPPIVGECCEWTQQTAPIFITFGLGCDESEGLKSVL